MTEKNIGFDEKDPLFNMQTFRVSKDLSEKHDDIYGCGMDLFLCRGLV